MSFNFHSSALRGKLSEHLHEKLQNALDEAVKNSQPLAAYVQRLEVESFSLGSVPPFVEFLEIDDGRPDIFGDSDGVAHSVEHIIVDEDPKGTAMNLEDYIGSDGLFLKVRCSYGGDMHCAVRCVLSYSHCIENKLTVGLSLPIACELRNLNVHFHLLCNFNDGKLQVAFEALPGVTNFALSPAGDATTEVSVAAQDEMQRTAPSIDFDLSVRFGATETHMAANPWGFNQHSIVGYAERFAIQFLPMRNAYRRLRAALFYPEAGRLEQFKRMFQRGFGNVQKIPAAMQRSLAESMRSFARIGTQRTGTYVDEVVIAAFVRDRLKLWVENNMVQPNCTAAVLK